MKTIGFYDNYGYANEHHICISTPVVENRPQPTEYSWTYTAEEREEKFPKEDENYFAPEGCDGTIFPFFESEIYKKNAKDNRRTYRILWEKKDIKNVIDTLTRLYEKMEN